MGVTTTLVGDGRSAVVVESACPRPVHKPTQVALAFPVPPASAAHHAILVVCELDTMLVTTGTLLALSTKLFFDFWLFFFCFARFFIYTLTT